jgi:hypothetical protein
MELHIGELNSEVEIGGGSPQLPADHIERIVRLVIERLESRERARKARADSVAIEGSLLRKAPWE